jgi:hypothetical protein
VWIHYRKIQPLQKDCLLGVCEDVLGKTEDKFLEAEVAVDKTLFC